MVNFSCKLKGFERIWKRPAQNSSNDRLKLAVFIMSHDSFPGALEQVRSMAVPFISTFGGCHLFASRWYSEISLVSPLSLKN